MADKEKLSVFKVGQVVKEKDGGWYMQVTAITKYGMIEAIGPGHVRVDWPSKFRRLTDREQGPFGDHS